MTPTCDDLADLAGILAPECRERLYVLRHCPELGPLSPLAGAQAIRSCVNHAKLRDVLTARGQWRGLHDAVVFVEEPSVPLFLHELGHLLPTSPEPTDIPPPDSDEREFQMMAMAKLAERDPLPSHRPPWNMHELPWIRRVLHLHHRAIRLGFDIDLRDCRVAGSWYGLSMPIDYAYELGAEPSYMAHCSFREIDTTPPPPRFTRLFEKDTRLWTS